jgi:hypothetical protein
MLLCLRWRENVPQADNRAESLRTDAAFLNGLPLAHIAAYTLRLLAVPQARSPLASVPPHVAWSVPMGGVLLVPRSSRLTALRGRVI